MKRRTNYVFGAALAGCAVSAIPGLLDKAQGATAADFTFESLASGLSVTGSTYGPYLADSGTGSAFGVHAVSSTAYSDPAGNGSAKSFSSNHFSVGDYYEFDVPTVNLTNIMISFDQTGSATGPSQFALEVSADGANYSSVAGYAVSTFSYSYSTTNSTTTMTTTSQTSFASGYSYSGFNSAFDLSAYTALDNDPSAAFRLVVTGSEAINGTATIGTGGTDRIDNVVVSGTAVPEPAALSLLTAAASALLVRRGKKPE